jgi:hypothetical protein
VLERDPERLGELSRTRTQPLALADSATPPHALDPLERLERAD